MPAGDATNLTSPRSLRSERDRLKRHALRRSISLVVVPIHVAALVKVEFTGLMQDLNLFGGVDSDMAARGATLRRYARDRLAGTVGVCRQ